MTLPPSLPSPCNSPSLLILLPLSPWDSVCLRECLFSVLSHVPVSERCSQHGLCCRGTEFICLHFYIEPLFLPHVVSSAHLNVLNPDTLLFSLITAANNCKSNSCNQQYNSYSIVLVSNIILHVLKAAGRSKSTALSVFGLGLMPGYMFISSFIFPLSRQHTEENGCLLKYFLAEINPDPSENFMCF